MKNEVSDNQILTGYTSATCREANTWLPLLQGSWERPAQTRCHLGWDPDTHSWVFTTVLIGPLEHTGTIPMLQASHTYLYKPRGLWYPFPGVQKPSGQDRLPPYLGQLIEETRSMWQWHLEIASWNEVRKNLDLACFGKGNWESMYLVMGYYGKACIRGLEQLYSTWGKRILLKCYQYLHLHNVCHPLGSVSDRLIQPL